MNSLVRFYPAGVALVLVQVLAALPWLAVVNLDALRLQKKQPSAARWLRWLVTGLVGLAGGGAVLAFLMSMGQVKDTLEFYGGVYGAVLHIQLAVDFFVLTFAVLLLVWPKGAAVALSAFREGWRQPMYWLLTVLGLVIIFVTFFLPYFTFGEDYKMVKELGYDIIMLCAALFAALAASMSISEEIEGRTAVTLMSKPVSRRQFLLGKFVGILLAAAMMIAILSLEFDGMLLKRVDRDAVPVPPYTEATAGPLSRLFGEVPGYFLHGAVSWACHVYQVFPGVLLGLCQVMVLLAVAVALATRLPMVVNLVVCLVVFFLGHLTPVLQQVSQNRYALVRFMAQLFDTLLPGLDLFNLGPAIARDTPPSGLQFLSYVGGVSGYACLYTAIALLLGLILFEDRDLA